MSYNTKNWKQWGKTISALLSWALKPGIFIIFLTLNWEYLLPVMGFLSLSFFQIFGGDDYFTDEDSKYLLFGVGQFLGTALLAIFCYLWFDQVLKRVPFFTYEGEKERLAQEEKNRLKFEEVMKTTITLDAVELYKMERERDRRLILEMREAFRNLKLEFEALRESKPNISDKSDTKDTSLDLFKKKKPTPSKRAPKRFVPRASFKKKPPEF